MFLDGMLISARHLVNDITITRVCGLDRVDYHHVELDSHDLILAEGAAAESFVDNDSRMLFQNAHEYKGLYPDAPASAGYCAPRVKNGAGLEALRRRLASALRAA